MTDDVKLEKTEAVKSDVSDPAVTGMKDSDIRWRAKYKGAREEIENLKIQTEKEVRDLQQNLNSALNNKKLFEQNLIEAKLEAKAISHGIMDTELVKLIDKSNLKLNEDGSIEGLEEAINDFKSKKPNFFGSDKKSSSSKNSTFTAENKSESKLIDAHSLSKEEWEKQQKRLLAGRF